MLSIFALSTLIGITLLLNGCAHYNKATSTFYGWGKYKDKDVEMESSPPISLPKVEI